MGTVGVLVRNNGPAGLSSRRWSFLAPLRPTGDLGQAMISLVRDLEPDLLILVTVVCYLLALMALAQGLLRLLKTSEDKFHAPSAGGTALSFLICIVLAALPSWIDAATESLFGTWSPPGTASLGYGGRGVDYDALLAAVFALIALVGLFAFIRGAFVLRAAADARPSASGARAFAHMAGGIAALAGAGWFWAAGPALAVSLGDMGDEAAGDLETVPGLIAIALYIIGAPPSSTSAS